MGAKLRVHSTQNLSVNPKDIELDKQQQKLSDLSSKYMMLFGIAMASTILFQIVSFCVHFNLRSIFYSLDFTVNLLCVYLQFSFANIHYVKCCKWCDGKCKDYISRRNKRMIYKHSLTLSASNQSAETETLCDRDSISKVTVDISNTEESGCIN